MILLSMVFFPGVVIHELAHFLMASVLFVRVGEMEFTPQMHGDGIKMGSVRIAKTDIFRRFLIGVAPLIVGLLILIITTYYMLPIISQLTFSILSVVLTVVYLYGIFVITNTMFSSKKDMEGALGLGLAVVFIMAVIVAAGKSEWITTPAFYVLNNQDIVDYLRTVVFLLLVPVGINVLLLVTQSSLKKIKK